MIRVGAGVVGLAVVLAAACSGEDDTAAQLERYEQFPVVPDAVQVSDSTYELQGDNGPTGEFGRRVVYELPDDMLAAEVLAFLRSNMPEGWTEATDATCVRLIESLAPPPPVPGSTIPPPEDMLLLFRESQLTVYAPGEDGLREDDGGVDGFSFTLSRDGDTKLLALEPVSMSCGVAQADVGAEEFDEGSRPVQVVPTVPR